MTILLKTVCVCVLVNRPSYHSSVAQVEGVPAEAQREAVGLLPDVVFVRFNRAMWCHGLSWRKTKQLDSQTQAQETHNKLNDLVSEETW